MYFKINIQLKEISETKVCRNKSRYKSNRSSIAKGASTDVHKIWHT